MIVLVQRKKHGFSDCTSTVLLPYGTNSYNGYFSTLINRKRTESCGFESCQKQNFFLVDSQFDKLNICAAVN